MLSNIKNEFAILLAFLAIYTIWGTTYLAIRFAVESIPPALLAGSRFAFAGSILYFFFRFTKKEKPKLIHWRSASITGFLMIVIAHGFVVWASKVVPSSLVALLISTVPLWMVLIDWLWGKTKKPSNIVFFAIFIGFCGIAILIGPGKIIEQAQGDILSILMLFISPIAWSAGSIYSKKAPLPKSSGLTSSMQMGMGGFILMIFSALSGEISGLDINSISNKSFYSFLYLVLFGSFIAFSAYIWLLKQTTAARVSTYTYVNAVVAMFVGWLIGNEILNMRIISAAALILLAVIIIIKSKEKNKQ